jgi:hypothetical protein
MLDAAQILNDPARLAAYVAGVVSSGTAKKEAMLALRQRARAQAIEIESEKERRYALFPELEKSSRESAARAARELEEAARALSRVSSLFFLLRSHTSADELALVEVGEEWAAKYAERAANEANFFAEAAQ